jgi:hypothetical protein
MWTARGFASNAFCLASRSRFSSYGRREFVRGEYEIRRDAYVKYYFNKSGISDEMELFDLIADQFKAGQLIISSETAWSYRLQLDSTPEGPERERMSKALNVHDDYQHKHKESAGKEQHRQEALEEDHGNRAITAQDASQFTDVTCLKYFTMKVPGGWRFLGSDFHVILDAKLENAAKTIDVTLPKGRVVVYTAISTPPSFASVHIEVADSAADRPHTYEDITESFLRNEERNINTKLRQALSLQRGELLTPSTVTRESFDGIPALVSKYRQQAAKGHATTSMEVITLFFPDKEVLMLLGYRESEGAMWKPIVQYMRQSIQRAVEVKSGVPVAEPEIRRAIPVTPPNASNTKSHVKTQ